jgi:hypothetical protein
MYAAWQSMADSAGLAAASASIRMKMAFQKVRPMVPRHVLAALHARPMIDFPQFCTPLSCAWAA